MKTFFISDQHFWHTNILSFKDQEGQLIRKYDSVEDMNNDLIEKHNRVISAEDKVYFLGDVVMRSTAKWFDILSELNGRKVLIKGNHDEAKLSLYSRHFSDIRSYKTMKIAERKVIFSHIPLHPDSVGNGFNVHGHLHYRTIEDPHYINVSVEQLDGVPMGFDTLFKIIRERLDIINNN